MGSDGGAPKNRQQLRTERSTDALLSAASELVVEGGLESLTFAAIGDRAGYSRGLVTARFGNKDGLIEALVDRILTSWNGADDPGGSASPGLEALLARLESVRRHAVDGPTELRVLHSLMFQAPSDVRLRRRFVTLLESFRNDLARTIRRGKRDGTISADADPDRDAAMIVAALQGAAYQWHLDPEGFDGADAIRFLIETTQQRLAA